MCVNRNDAGATEGVNTAVGGGEARDILEERIPAVRPAEGSAIPEEIDFQMEKITAERQTGSRLHRSHRCWYQDHQIRRKYTLIFSLKVR